MRQPPYCSRGTTGSRSPVSAKTGVGKSDQRANVAHFQHTQQHGQAQQALLAYLDGIRGNAHARGLRQCALLIHTIHHTSSPGDLCNANTRIDKSVAQQKC
jgi:hypothetical protein